MSKVLTQELALFRSKADNLYNIRKLNVWGNELIDISIIRQMPNVEVLSLSVNKISSLREFANCLKLQELYLRKNNIQDLSEIRYLLNLTELRALWLSDNPCAETPNYRLIVIKFLPNIVKLDDKAVEPAERDAAAKLNVALEGVDSTKQEEDTSSPKMKKRNTQYEQPEEPIEKASPEIRRSKSIASPQKANKPVSSNERNEKIPDNSREVSLSGISERDENIVCSILTLLKELDAGSLQLLLTFIEKQQKYNSDLSQRLEAAILKSREKLLQVTQEL